MTSYWSTVELAATSTLCTPNGISIGVSVFNELDCFGDETDTINFIDGYGVTTLIHRKIVILGTSSSCTDGI